MRTVAYIALVLAATALFIKRGLANSDGDYTAPRHAAIDAGGARLVRVTGAAGELRVVGVDGIGEVRVRGTAHASRRRGLDGVKVELRRDGNDVVVRSVIQSPKRNWFGRSTSQSLDMVVEVPASLEADVTDGSGDAEVDGVSALRVTDGSGNLRVVNVRGPVRVTDGSGELEMRGVAGDVWLTDGSGNVSVHDLTGSLVVAVDGSGELSADGVHGDVLVQQDGSGDIDVANVGGRLIVKRAGSGEVRHRDVRGAVDVPPGKVAHRE